MSQINGSQAEKKVCHGCTSLGDSETTLPLLCEAPPRSCVVQPAE